MGPREPKDVMNPSGKVDSSGKGKAKKGLPATSSNAIFEHLTSEEVDSGVAAVNHLSKIFSFVQAYHNETEVAEGIYGDGVRQQIRINELERTLEELAFRKDQEMARLQDENDTYRTNTTQFEKEKSELERQKKGMNDTRKAMTSELRIQKEQEISVAKQKIVNDVRAKSRQARDDHEKQIQALQTGKTKLEDVIKTLKQKMFQATEDFEHQRGSWEVEKRSAQSYIKKLEVDIQQINAASTVSPRTPQFYIDGFCHLWEDVQDIALNCFRYLPEDAKTLDSDAVREQLCSASSIFKYPSLSSESDVSTFLRTCAIEDFLSSKIIAIIQRRYFAKSMAVAENESGYQPIDSILDTISDVPAANPSQELSWRLTTVQKLDGLGSRDQLTTARISTEPNPRDIVRTILDQIHHFQSPNDSGLYDKLTEMTLKAIKLWRTLRTDSCRIEVDYNVSRDDQVPWSFVHDMGSSSPKTIHSASDIPEDQLPSESFVLFPRILGCFEADDTKPRILHVGSALSHDSAVFRRGLEEIETIRHARKAFERNLRKGSSAQSSPIIAKHNGEWASQQLSIH